MSETTGDRFSQESMRFTASVMGNPEYLAAVKGIKPARDQRAEGLEKLNAFHAHHHAERLKAQKENHGPR